MWRLRCFPVTWATLKWTVDIYWSHVMRFGPLACSILRWGITIRGDCNLFEIRLPSQYFADYFSLSCVITLLRVTSCLTLRKKLQEIDCFWNACQQINAKLEIRSVERGICPIATLHSLPAAYKGGRCKQGAIVFHGGRVIVNFVPKFIAMATGVSKGEI